MQVEDIAAFYGRKSSSVRPTTSVTTVGAVVRRQHSDASMLNLTLLLWLTNISFINSISISSWDIEEFKDEGHCHFLANQIWFAKFICMLYALTSWSFW